MPPTAKPKPRGSDSEVTGELFAKLKKRKVKQGEGMEAMFNVTEMLQFFVLDVTDAGRTEYEDDDEFSHEGSEPLLDDVVVSV